MRRCIKSEPSKYIGNLGVTSSTIPPKCREKHQDYPHCKGCRDYIPKPSKIKMIKEILSVPVFQVFLIAIILSIIIVWYSLS